MLSALGVFYVVFSLALKRDLIARRNLRRDLRRRRPGCRSFRSIFGSGLGGRFVSRGRGLGADRSDRKRRSGGGDRSGRRRNILERRRGGGIRSNGGQRFGISERGRGRSGDGCRRLRIILHETPAGSECEAA